MSPTPEEATAACRLLDDLTRTASDVAYRFEHIESLPATEAILGADQRTQMAIIREGIERLAQMRDRLGKPQGLDVRYMNLLHEQGYPKFPLLVATRLLRRKLPWESDDLAYLVNRTADLGMVSIFCEPFLPVLVNLVGRHAKSHPMPADLRRGL